MNKKNLDVDGINVFGAFDGISCGQVALKNMGIKVNKYYASEIESNAIAIANFNFKDTIQMGDIKNIQAKDIDKIDLLFGGSPCQSLSIANRSSESGLKSGKSTIFYEYVRLKKELKPRFFLFENVSSMKKEDKDEISRELGVEPILINSKSLVPQLRGRLYWTNIPQSEIMIKNQKKLNDILEDGYSERENAYCITATYSRSCVQDYFLFGQRQMVFKHPFTVEYKEEVVEQKKRKILYFTTNGKTYRIDKKGNGAQLKEQGINEAMRKMKPVECEILQGLKRDYTKFGCFNGEVKEIKDSNRYQTIGNGWTVSVIEHLIANLKECIQKC